MTKGRTCWYKKDTPQTLISPFKAELHNREPPVLQFYEVLSETVIQSLIGQASPLLKRATVSGNGEPSAYSDVRISTFTAIYRQTDGLLETIERLIFEMTGLNTTPDSTSEVLQVSSYGAIGGYYTPHFDTFYEDVVKCIRDKLSALSNFQGTFSKFKIIVFSGMILPRFWNGIS